MPDTNTEKPPILFTPQQYDLLQMGLTIIMRACKEQVDEGVVDEGAEDRFREAVALSRDLEQNIMRGEGLSPELRERFQQRMAVSHQNKDEAGVMRSLRDFIAALVRLEPDPARSVANVTMNAMLRSNSAQAGAIFIPLVQQKLIGLKKNYENEGYPTTQDFLTYLDEWLTFGHANLKAGEEAWPGDTDLTGHKV